MSLELNLEALSEIAARLASAAQDVGATGSRAPGGVDAGAATDAAIAIMTRLTENAARLCEGLDLAAQHVDESRNGYASVDSAAQDRMSRLGGAG